MWNDQVFQHLPFTLGKLRARWLHRPLLLLPLLVRSENTSTGDKTVDALHPFDNTEVAFCARTECLKSLFVSLAFVGCQRSFETVKFDNDRSLLQA